MAVADSIIYEVDVVDGVSTVCVPAVSGKRVRVWRVMLTFSGAGHNDKVLTWDAGGVVPSEFFVSGGDRMILSYEALSWTNGEIGAPLTLAVNGQISIKGTIRAEHV